MYHLFSFDQNLLNGFNLFDLAFKLIVEKPCEFIWYLLCLFPIYDLISIDCKYILFSVGIFSRNKLFTFLMILMKNGLAKFFSVNKTSKTQIKELNCSNLELLMILLKIINNKKTLNDLLK